MAITQQLPLVSVVTTCYHHAPYLPDYFNGLLQQTYPNVELIFLDDGSLDGSWDIALQFESALRNQLARVTLIRQNNQGMFAAIRRATSEATGEYFCLLESDDYYLPTKIEENIVYLLERPDYGMVHSDFDHVREYRLEPAVWSTEVRQIPTGWIFHSLLRENCIRTCTTCIRTEMIRRFVDWDCYRSKGYLMADYPMCLDIARHAQVGYIDRPLARYRILGESASHSKDPKKRARFWMSQLLMRAEYVFGEVCHRTPMGMELRDEILGAAYCARELREYNVALRGYMAVARYWGVSADIVLGVGKLLPHRYLTRVPKSLS